MQASDISANREYLNEDFVNSPNVTPCLKSLLESKQKVPAGTVLQLQSVSNISVPKKAQEESRVHYDPLKHCLKFSVTDGSFTGIAYLFDGHPGLSDQTPPGTKIRIQRDLAFKNKLLIFTKESVEVMGGHVKLLVDAWRVSKDLDRTYHVWGNPTGKPLASADAGPPKWKEFNYGQAPLKIMPELKKKAVTKEDEDKPKSEFEQQRIANISRITEQLGDLQFSKTFGEGKQLMRKDVLDIIKEGFTEEEAENALTRFKTVKNALKHLQPKPNSEDQPFYQSTQKVAQNTKKPNPKLLNSYDYSDEDEYNPEYEKQKHNSTNTLFDFVKQAIPKTDRGPTSAPPSADTQQRDFGRGRGHFNEHNNYGPRRFHDDQGVESFGRGSYTQSRSTNYNSYNDNNDTQYYDTSRGSGFRGRGRGGRFNESSGRRGRGGSGTRGNNRGRSTWRSRGGEAL